MFQAVLRKSAQKELNNLAEKDKAKVSAAILTLSQNPFIGKKLSGELAGLYSYRVWPFRIIYDVYKNQLMIHILRIAHRQGSYK
jgi:mRNA interferase RelE/StbE